MPSTSSEWAIEEIAEAIRYYVRNRIDDLTTKDEREALRRHANIALRAIINQKVERKMSKRRIVPHGHCMEHHVRLNPNTMTWEHRPPSSDVFIPVSRDQARFLLENGALEIEYVHNFSEMPR